MHNNTHKRILIVSPLPPPVSGIGTWTQIVCSESKKLGEFEIEVVDTAVRWRQPVNMNPLGRAVGGSIQAFIITAKVFGRLLLNRPDVVHLCTSAGPSSVKDFVLVVLCTVLRVPSFIHFHTSRVARDFRRKNAAWFVTITAAKLATMVIVLDRETEWLVKKARGGLGVELLSNPVDIEDIQCHKQPAVRKETTPITGESFKVVFVGHVVEAKGVDLLVRACSAISDVTLNIVGPVLPGYKAMLSGLASTRAGGNWLTFMGAQDRIATLGFISDADLVCIPSRKVYEASPYSVLEAMTLAKPVIATTVGALPYVLDVASTHPAGICVEPGSAQALTSALLRMKNDPLLLRELGAHAEERVRLRFGAELLVGRLNRLWSNHVASGQRAHFLGAQ